MSRLPNFFIIGAPKCGTTSLAAWLAEHPKIYMSPLKEPFFFCDDLNVRLITSWEDYIRLFEGAKEEHAIGEASSYYLFSKTAIPNIEAGLHNARYIAMVRNPVDMAYSWYMERLRWQEEDILDFRTAWDLSPERRSGRSLPKLIKEPALLDYQRWCLLGEQLERLYSVVSRNRVLVIVLDDLKENPRREYLRVLDFLGVSDDGRERFPVYNVSRQWRNRYIGGIIVHMFRAGIWLRYQAKVLPAKRLGIGKYLDMLFTRRQEKKSIPSDIRAELEAFFAEDIHRLERLLGREFPRWKSVQERTG